jgi:hypothetical protein
MKVKQKLIKLYSSVLTIFIQNLDNILFVYVIARTFCAFAPIAYKYPYSMRVKYFQLGFRPPSA